VQPSVQLALEAGVDPLEGEPEEGAAPVGLKDVLKAERRVSEQISRVDVMIDAVKTRLAA